MKRGKVTECIVQDKIINYKQISLIFACNIIFAIIYSWIRDLIFSDSVSNSLERDFDKNIVFYSIFIVLMAPLMEELAFRYPLVLNRKNYFSIIILVLFLFSVSQIITKLLLSVFIITVSLNYFVKNRILSYFLVIFSILAFTSLHFDNSTGNAEPLNYFDHFLLTIPQLVLGVVLTFLRINQSFLTVFIYHVGYNAVLLLLILLGRLSDI